MNLHIFEPPSLNVIFFLEFSNVIFSFGSLHIVYT